MQGIWCRRYAGIYGDPLTLALARKEWAWRISHYTPDELDQKLEMAKGSLEWPDIDKILAIPLVKTGPPKLPRPPTEAEAKRQRSREIGEAALRELLDSLPEKPADFPKRRNRTEEELAKEQRLLMLAGCELTYGRITEETLAEYRRRHDEVVWGNRGILALADDALVTETHQAETPPADEAVAA